jgi:DNA-binding MarR family transcriptional regulator
MIERSPGVTRIIDRLEARGLVRRERREGDRRCVHCRITATGLEILAQLDQPVREANRRALAPLNNPDLSTATELLARVANRSRHP